MEDPADAENSTPVVKPAGQPIEPDAAAQSDEWAQSPRSFRMSFRNAKPMKKTTTVAPATLV